MLEDKIYWCDNAILKANTQNQLNYIYMVFKFMLNCKNVYL